MNKDRRKRISEIQATLDAAKADLESVASEERDAFENMPENMQQGDKGQAMEQAADALEEAVSELDSIIENLGAIE